MIKINIKLGVTTEQKKREPKSSSSLPKRNKKTSRWAIHFDVHSTRHRIEQDIMFVASHVPHGKSFQFIVRNESTLCSFFSP